MADESAFNVEDELGDMLENFDPSRDALETFQDMADEVVAYAQDNAPWSDITGEARNGLTAEVYDQGGEVVLDLVHTVDYGVWLETIQNGRFAIIMPTLERFAPEIFSAAGGHIVGETGGDL